MASVSIVVPAYKEAQNIPVLVERLNMAFDRSSHSCSVIIVDDNSMDGTVEAVSELKKKVFCSITCTHAGKRTFLSGFSRVCAVKR